MTIIIIIIILLIIIWLIVAPIIISIDTEKKELLFEYSRIIRFRAVLVDYLPVMTIELPFKKFRLKLDGGKAKPKKADKKEKQKKKRKNKRRLSAAKIYAMSKAGIVFVKKTLKSMKLKRAEIYLDTEDYPLNAMLIPVFCAIERKNIFAEINFVGYNKVFVKMQHRAVYILWQGIILASKLFYIIFFRRK
jgi:hypothetical protein